jgi:hypothetical protein
MILGACGEVKEGEIERETHFWRKIVTSRSAFLRSETIVSNHPAGGWLMSAERNEALHRLAAPGGARTLSSVAPVAAGYERDTAS